MVQPIPQGINLSPILMPADPLIFRRRVFIGFMRRGYRAAVEPDGTVLFLSEDPSVGDVQALSPHPAGPLFPPAPPPPPPPGAA